MKINYLPLILLSLNVVPPNVSAHETAGKLCAPAFEESVATAKNKYTDNVLEEFYSKNKGLLYNVAFRIVRDRADAEDVVQDAFLKAWQRRETFRGDSRLSTWVFTIVANTGFYHLRRSRRRNEIFVSTTYISKFSVLHPENEESLLNLLPTQMIEGKDTHIVSGEQRILQKEAAAILNKAINSLRNPNHREIFEYRALFQISIEETAQSLSLNINTVKNRLFRAKKELLNTLSQQAPDYPGGVEELLRNVQVSDVLELRTPPDL